MTQKRPKKAIQSPQKTKQTEADIKTPENDIQTIKDNLADGVERIEKRNEIISREDARLKTWIAMREILKDIGIPKDKKFYIINTKVNNTLE